MAEEHRPELVDLEHDRLGQAGEEGALLVGELRGRPVGQLPVGVAADPDGTVAEAAQQLQALGRKGTRGDVAADEHEVRRLERHVVEHRLECGQVAVDVVQRRDAH